MIPRLGVFILFEFLENFLDNGIIDYMIEEFLQCENEMQLFRKYYISLD